jgi:hypothetical protein
MVSVSESFNHHHATVRVSRGKRRTPLT